MIRFSLSFALILGLCAAPASADDWGSVEGQVILKGNVPEQAFLVAKGDKNVKDAVACSVEGVIDDSIIIDPKTKGIANVVVYMQRAPSKIHPDLKESSEKQVEFDQKGCRFLPHLMIVRTDQDILCLSDDSVAHNLHSNPFANTAQNFIVQPHDRAGTVVKMPVAERNPVKIQCDIHPWMAAYWVVVDHPYAAVTDETGKFKIENLPAGSHDFRVWNPKAGNIERKLTVKVKGGETTKVPTIEVSASSFKK